jgi:deazaflavin-dependent oxidoreductase (nitroreductase family)
MPQRGKSKKSAVVKKKSPSTKAAPVGATTKAKAAPVKAKAAATMAKAAAKAKAVAVKAGARSAATPSRESDSQPQPAPKLPRWMQDHLDRYLASNGADGHIWRGVPTLLLTTTGRSSGEERMLPLIYGRDGDRYVVVASRGGAPDHPAWYKNLAENPSVRVQVAAHRFRARARTANRDERPRLWRAMTRIWPAYDQYQSRTGREIPVVVIERLA